MPNFTLGKIGLVVIMIKRCLTIDTMPHYVLIGLRKRLVMGQLHFIIVACYQIPWPYGLQNLDDHCIVLADGTNLIVPITIVPIAWALLV